MEENRQHGIWKNRLLFHSIYHALVLGAINLIVTSKTRMKRQKQATFSCIWWILIATTALLYRCIQYLSCKILHGGALLQS